MLGIREERRCLSHGEGRKDQLLRDLVYVLHAQELSHASLRLVHVRARHEIGDAHS